MKHTIEIDREIFIAELSCEVRINAVWLDGETAAKQGFPLRETRKDGVCRLSVKNDSGKTAKLGGFRWRHAGHHGDFLHAPAGEFRIDAEGWMMASPCGVKRYGDRDFSYHPDYLRFAVCAPEDMSDLPNRFHAEHCVTIRNDRTGKNLLAGFVTSAHQFGRFLIALDEDGVGDFSMISDCDDRELDAGETADSEELAFFAGPDAVRLRERFAELWGEKMNARKKFAPPLGWCSWYYYFDKVRESDILENVRWFASRRADFPIEYIQLDDGYQSALGDWLVCNEKFPNGLQYLAQEIRKAGYKPALWLAPFMVEENSVLLREHPDWMIRDRDGGTLFACQWRESHRVAVLDGTHPEVQAFFRGLFRTLREWGYGYVKLDFMVQETSRGKLFDRRATRAEALRRGLEAIREGFGEDGFILGCTVPFGPVVGIVDGERVSTDITPFWKRSGTAYDEAPNVPNVCRNIIHHSYMNRRIWINDPDTHIARIDNNELTENEVILWTNAVRLGGGMLLFSDRFSTLAPERAVFSKSLIADQDQYVSHPLDVFRNAFPRLWLGKHRKTGELLLGVFNFDDAKTDTEILPAELPAHAVLADTANGETFALDGAPVAIPVEAHSVRMFSVR